jgi:hypothetical protein
VTCVLFYFVSFTLLRLCWFTPFFYLPRDFTVSLCALSCAFRTLAAVHFCGVLISPSCVVPPGVFCTVVTASPFVRYIVVRGVPARSRQQEAGCTVVDVIEYPTVVGCITFYIHAFMFILLSCFLYYNYYYYYYYSERPILYPMHWSVISYYTITILYTLYTTIYYIQYFRLITNLVIIIY